MVKVRSAVARRDAHFCAQRGAPAARALELRRRQRTPVLARQGELLDRQGRLRILHLSSCPRVVVCDARTSLRAPCRPPPRVSSRSFTWPRCHTRGRGRGTGHKRATMGPLTHPGTAFLFDLDGTLV